MKLNRSVLILAILINSMGIAFSQSDTENKSKFMLGKDLMNQSRYSAAMQVFLPLTSETNINDYSKPSHYFYAFSAFKSRDLENSKMMLLQLIQRYNDWEYVDDAYYLLSNVYFEQQKYRLALQFLYKVKNIKDDNETMKAFYLSQLRPTDSLIALQKDNPKDITLAKVLAKRITQNVSDEKEKMLLNFLVQEYKLDLNSLNVNTNIPTKTKDSYNVAVLLPFMLNEMDTKSGKRSNQYIVEFYEGMKLAIDSLKAFGIKINLYAYDTEKETTKISAIIALPEIKNMDVIVGPVFPNQIPLVTDFCKKNNIVNISPFSANAKIIEDNEFTFLAQPTLEVQAGAVASYASANFTIDSSKISPYDTKLPVEKKGVIIFHSNELKDSLLAYRYKDSVTAKGLKVTNIERITKDRVSLMKTILGDTLKLSKTNNVFIATSDEVVAANAISLLEISRQNVPVVVRSEWLMFNLLSFEQFEKRNTYFIHTDFFNPAETPYQWFKYKYISKTNLYPTPFSIQGYELLKYFGNALKKYGTYFKYGISQDGYYKSYILQGFDYSNSFTNKVVPLTKLKDKKLMVVNGRQ